MAFLMAFLMSIVPQSAYAKDSNAKYQIHTTSATKKIVVRGGASRLFQFTEGMALVKHRNGWFVIDKQGVTFFMDKSGKFAWNNSTQRDTKCMEYVPEGYCVWIMYNDSVAPAYAPIHIMDSSFKKVGVIDPMKQKLYFGGDIVASNAQWFQLKDSGDNRLFDWKGNLLLEFNDLNNSVFSEGLCPTYQEYKYNCFYINERGEIIVKFEDTKF